MALSVKSGPSNRGVAEGFTQSAISRKMNNNDRNHLEMRTMDLGDLHIFRAVVQAGGITRAAERLNRVQSNVTTRVRQLESELGVELFIRNGKKLHLARLVRELEQPLGVVEQQLSRGREVQFLAVADEQLDPELADEAREAVHDAKPRGLLRLGSME